MAEKIPLPTVSRLCSLYQALCDLERKGETKVSSSALGEMLGVGAHNIRKDLSCFGESGSSKTGYSVLMLKDMLSRRFGFFRKRKTCVVGLGNLGEAIIHNRQFGDGDFQIVAGFDSNINLVETIKTQVDLFAAYEMVRVVKNLQIEIAILTVSASGAQEAVDRLVEGGIKGIINFTPAVIKEYGDIAVRNVDLTGEFRVLSALIFLKNT